jgi:phthiocerol/phenolphthiocerol synthesis type-I polyketide synthase E
VDEALNMIEDDSVERIAVVGFSCRFPGAKNSDEFWHNLRDGVDSIRRFSTEELVSAGVPDEWLNDSNFVRAGALLDNIDLFDAEFFKYSPREAVSIDPQQRIFMETAWEALEHAGCNPYSYGAPIGVFAGANPNEYQLLLPVPDPRDVASAMELLIGNEKDFLSTRLSYKFNLKGPCLTVQTGCSTSLVAVQLACQSLLNYQCSMSLAGGVSVGLRLGKGYFYQEGTIASPDGYCRVFDAKARGTVLGQGVGVVVLKRLADALGDGDTIHAVIRACAINNDGAGKIGFTAPSVQGQAEVIALAHTLSGVPADTVSYVEAHGTGTQLGDPVEVAALSKAFSTSTSKTGFCAIGSVKSNIGHTDAAAGIAGLIKTILMLREKSIPPSLHFESPNPEIDFVKSPFYVPTRLMGWETHGIPRRAGVSSFGIGGTNVHAVLEEAPSVPPSGPSRSHQLILLSARSASALDAATLNLARHLEEVPGLSLADAAYTLKVGRKNFKHRRAVVCRSREDAVFALKVPEKGVYYSGSPQSGEPSTVFMFTGQGSQYAGMGEDLYRGESVFREVVDTCAEMLLPALSVDIRKILYPEDGVAEADAGRINQTALAQPALFVIDYALAKLWESWGVRPRAMVGHSIGEYVAACLAGVFDLESALAVVAARGRLMQEMPLGAMLAVAASETEIERFLNDKLALAAVNSPGSCVVSGDFTDIGALEEQLDREKVVYKRLVTSHAFHSHMMETAAQGLAGEIGRYRLQPPRIPFLSNRSGTWITHEQATSPGYWAEHLRRTVRFSQCVETLLKEGNQVFLEVGPGNTLCTLAKQQPARPAGLAILTSLRHSKEDRSDVEYILTTLGRLWLSGVNPDWVGFYANERRRRIPLPTYPFERQRFWPEPQRRPSTDPASVYFPLPLNQGSISSSTENTKQNPPLPASALVLPEAEAGARTATEQSMAEIWQRVLGIKRIGAREDYFELGGSSLLAVRLFSEIERTFGKKLPLVTLMEAPTVEQLSRFITTESNDTSWNSLTPIRREGTRPPFFFVHAAGGNLIIYKDLARHMGPDQPVYGFQSRGLDGSHAFLTRIEDMAAAYIEELLAFQPEGPYLLGGYCMGGTIALEMAQQLRVRGRKVSLLAMLETYNWSKVWKRPLIDDLFFYFQKIEFHLRNLLLSDDLITFFNEKLKVLRSRKDVWMEMIQARLSGRPGSNNDQEKNLYRIWHTNDKAALNYTGRSYSGRVTLFRAVRQYALFEQPEAGWDRLAHEGVDVHVLPVYPAGMLLEPFVRKLAKDLNSCIEKAIKQ